MSRTRLASGTLVAAAAGLLLGVSPSAASLPPPTSGSAVVAGTRIPLRSALVWRDGFGDISLLLTPRPASCATVAARRRGSYVSGWIHVVGPRLRAGRTITGSGKTRLVVSFGRGATRAVPVQRSVRLRLTRVERRAGSVWRGRLSVASTRIGGAHFGAGVSFAARWCGRR